MSLKIALWWRIAAFAVALNCAPGEAQKVSPSPLNSCLTENIIFSQAPTVVAIRGGFQHDDHIIRAVRDWARAMETAVDAHQLNSDVEIKHSNVAPGIDYQNSMDDLYWDACLRVEIVDALANVRIGEAFEFSTSSVGIRLLKNHGYSVVAHEIGHVLGLGHSQDRNAIMFFEFSSKLGLNEDDIAGAKDIYRLHLKSKKDKGDLPNSPPPGDKGSFRISP